MSRFQQSYAERMRADGKFPVVLRLESIKPEDVRGIIRHAKREGEEKHTDPARKHLNRTLYGSESIAGEVLETQRKLSEFNLQSNVVGLRKTRGPKAASMARKRGHKEPWVRLTKSRGPLREGILTVHRDWCRADENTPPDAIVEFLDDNGDVARHDRRKYEWFAEVGLQFLKETYGELLAYARMDGDEQSVHIHFVLVGIVKELPSNRYANGRYLFRTSHHPCIGGDGKRRGYELAQDAAGEFFQRPEHKHMNIVRAEPRAARRREAENQAEKLIDAHDLLVMAHATKELPSGSKNAKAMHLLKLEMAEAIERKGDAKRVRKDDADNMALDYLELLGVIPPDKRREASTRRARTALLAQYEDTYGTAKEIIADPDRVAEKALKEARKRIKAEEEAAATRIKKASETAKVALEIVEKEKLRSIEREEKRRRAMLEAKKAVLEKREAKLKAKEQELVLRERMLVKWAQKLLEQAKAVEALAARLKDPAKEVAAKAANSFRSAIRKFRGHEL